MAGAQGQVEVRDTPDRVTGDARRVRVPVRRDLRTRRGAGESGAGDGAGVAAAGRPSAVPCRQDGTLRRSEPMPLLVSCELSFRELTSVVHDAGYASVDRVS